MVQSSFTVSSCPGGCVGAIQGFLFPMVTWFRSHGHARAWASLLVRPLF